MPNRKAKKADYVKQYKTILEELNRLGADIDSIKEQIAYIKNTPLLFSLLNSVIAV